MNHRSSPGLAFVVVLFTLAAAVPATGAWLPGWLQRLPVQVDNACGTGLVDHEVRIILDGSFDFGLAAADGSDLRVCAADGVTELPFWIESFEPAQGLASLHVAVPDLPAGGSASIYVYYGKDGAAPAGDATAVFTAYDGFEAPIVTNAGEWARYPGNPVLTEGAPGSWDDHGATFASVIWDSAAVEFRMYYHGFSGGTHQIGLATSADGVNWTKHAGNPIMTPGPAAWDGNSVRVPMVWKEGADYHMIYTGAGSGGMQVGYATSSDGIAWTKNPANPVFNDPTWASGETENWGVIKVGDEYQMWYSDFGVRQSGLAVSTDLVNWAPYQTDPIFATSGDPGDDRYSQFCPSSFKYGDDFYVLVPSYDAGANYSKYYLYKSASPYFPVAERELVRIAHTVGPAGAWDSHDSDTPLVLTLDIERTQFYNDELWCYYAGEGGTDHWKVGLHLEPDIAAALAPVAPPPASAITWATVGDVTRVGDPVRQGGGAMLLADASPSGAVQLAGSFAARQAGVAEAWLRRDNTTAGDFDLYLYGNGGATLAAVAGLGRNGDFHYWNGSFQPTGVAWSVGAWYLVGLAFDAATGTYDFTVRDEAQAEIVRVEGVSFGNAAASLGRVMAYTSSGFVGAGLVDDARVRSWCGAEPGVAIGAEELNPLSAVPGAGRAALAVLHQNVPNPLNPATRIDYELAAPGRVALAVYDLQGRRVATLVDRLQDAGRHSVLWQGRDDAGRAVATGVYLYRLEAGGTQQARRLVLMR
ncbi:MAG: DUF2341 domain-containing protein [Candidatus Krumholzibacteriia bacterium]